MKARGCCFVNAQSCSPSFTIGMDALSSQNDFLLAAYIYVGLKSAFHSQTVLHPVQEA